MATEYEGIDRTALAYHARDVAVEERNSSGNPVAATDLGFTINVMDAVLARLQADGRLITGDVETEYGRTYPGDPHVYRCSRSNALSPRSLMNPVQRAVSYGPWLPVSDIGNDQGDNDD